MTRATLILILFGAILVDACYQKSQSKNESKRISGSDVTIEDYPYMARVIAKTDGKWQLTCGAVIIGEDFALTVSYCVTADGRRDDFRIMSGSAALNGGTTHTIKAKETHWGCSGRKVDCLTVIKVAPKFKKPKDGWIEFTDDYDETAKGTKATVAGWGQPDSDKLETHSPKLRKTEVELISKDLCAPTYSAIYYAGKNNEEKVLCSSLKKDQLCYADRGGPLIVNNKLAGILAGAQFCGDLDAPALYLSILWYENWIQGRKSDLEKEK